MWGWAAQEPESENQQHEFMQTGINESNQYVVLGKNLHKSYKTLNEQEQHQNISVITEKEG